MFKLTHKFSLIELLVVLAIFAILISLLQPALISSLNYARTVKCQNNLKQFGTALQLYMSDHSDFYPLTSNWGNLAGPKGSMRIHGGFTLPENRPLNPYLDQATNISECPSDKGDSLHVRGENSFINCYREWGLSYLGQWRFDWHRVKHVFDNIIPVSFHEITSTHNKLILADWPWHPNRILAETRSQWHSSDSRSFNTLFADGHAKLFEFPIEYENGSFSRLPFDPNFAWW